MVIRQTLSNSLDGKRVFLSASIPDPARWDGEFDPFEITDAVVAAARAVITSGGTLVTAAHPTIAPLLMYVAAELPDETRRCVSVYQSRLFEDVLPEATQRFRDEGVADFHWTEPAPGDSPDPHGRGLSLKIMRETMLRETDPAAAIFVGGMEGIVDEFDLFQAMFPGRPTYPIGRAGGESGRLAEMLSASPLNDELRSDDVYPSLFRRIVSDIRAE